MDEHNKVNVLPNPKSMEDQTIDFLMGLFNDRQRFGIDSWGCFYLGFAIACVSKNKDDKKEGK